MRQRSGKIPEREWPLPHPIPEPEFNRLCDQNDVQAATRDALRRLLDDLVEYSRVFLDNIKDQSPPGYYKSECLRQIEHLQSVRKWLQSLKAYESRREWPFYDPPPAIQALSRAAAYWLVAFIEPKFLIPFHGSTPHFLSPAAHGSGPRDLRFKRVWTENVIQDNSLDVLLAVFGSLEGMLTDAAAYIARHTPRGGPRRYKVGPFFLMNVAGAYSLIGKKPAKNIDGPFGEFACAVVAGVGWDTSWVGSHIRSAVAEWERQAKKVPHPARR